MLYCLVTRKEINNIPSHIQNHVMGRKFQRDLKICKYELYRDASIQPSAFRSGKMLPDINIFFSLHINL